MVSGASLLPEMIRKGSEFLGSSGTLKIWVWSESEQNYTHNDPLFITHKPKILRNYISSEETHLGWCPSSRTSMLQKASNPQGFYWVCPLPAAQTPWSLCPQYRFLRPWPHWPLLDPKAFSHFWPHGPGPREPCLEPRDFVDNAICFQENSPGNTTPFLNDPRKIQSSFAVEPLFSQAGGAAPGSAAWLCSHCWKRVRAERISTVTGVALQLPFSCELHPRPDLRHGPFPSYPTAWAQPVPAGCHPLSPLGFPPAPSLGLARWLQGSGLAVITIPCSHADGLTCHRRAWPCQPHRHSWLLACSYGAAHTPVAMTSLWNSENLKDALLFMF